MRKGTTVRIKYNNRVGTVEGYDPKTQLYKINCTFELQLTGKRGIGPDIYFVKRNELEKA